MGLCRESVAALDSDSSRLSIAIGNKKTGLHKLKVNSILGGENYRGEISTFVLDDPELPIFIDPRNGDITELDAINKKFTISLNGTGFHQIWIYVHQNWRIVNDEIIGYGVLSDLEDDDKPIPFAKKKSLKISDHSKVEVFEITTDESSVLSIDVSNGLKSINVAVDISAYSGKSSYEVRNYYTKLIHENRTSLNLP